MSSSGRSRSERSSSKRAREKEDHPPNTNKQPRSRGANGKNKKKSSPALDHEESAADDRYKEALTEQESQLKQKDEEIRRMKAQLESMKKEQEEIARREDVQGGRRWARRSLMNKLPGAHEEVVRHAKWFLKRDKFPPPGYHVYSEMDKTLCQQIMRNIAGGKPRKWTKEEYWGAVVDAWKYQLQMRRNIGLQKQKALEIGKLRAPWWAAAGGCGVRV